MTNSNKPFQYPLEPIIKKNNWDINALKIEAAQAKQVVENHIAEADKLRAEIEKVEHEMRADHRHNYSISREKYEVAKTFLDHRYVLLTAKQKEQEQAERVHEQIVAQLRSLKQSTKGLENHKRGKKKIHQMQQERAAIAAADDAWLMRRRKK